MPAVILDACTTLNLYACGRFESVLTAVQNDWYVPVAVEREAQLYRQPDPTDATKLIVVPIDLAPVINNGLLTRCDCESEQESELYLEIASKIRDDGESMGLAIAKFRGWAVLTDDKKARKIAIELGIGLLGTTQVMKQWTDAVQPNAEEVAATLEAIERFANYRPGHTVEHYAWWAASLRVR